MQSSEHEHVHGEVVPRRGMRHRVAGLALLVVTLIAVPFALQGTAGAGPAAPRLAAASCDGGTYTVVRGDSWYGIAARLKVNALALLAANSATAATVIHPGNVLCLPAGAATTTTTTKPVVTTTTAAPAATPSPTTTTATPTTVPAQKGLIRQFPVQGLCWFTDSWGAPRSGGRKHQGVDIIAPTGKAVYAADSGTLTKQYVDAPGALSGNGWRLTRADGTYYFYGHFSRFAPGLVVGSKVTAGQIIGYVGMTGNAGVPHLHFEVHPGGGAPINPTPVVKALDGCGITAVVAQPTPGATTTTVKSGVTTTTAKPVTTTTKPGATTTTIKPGVTTTTAKPVTTTTKPGATTTTKPVTTTTKPVTTTTKPVVTTTAAPTTTTTPPPPALTKWQFITPVMAMNTVLEGRRMVAGKSAAVSVSGLVGVTPSTTGVMVRLVVRNVSAPGSVSLHACGASAGAPALSFTADRLGAVVATVPVRNGTFCITSTTAVDLRVAVMAQLAPTGTARMAVGTRTLALGVVAAGGTRNLTVAQLAQPAGAQAVQVTITLQSPAGAGSFGIGSCGGTPWIVAFPAAASQTYTAVVRTNSAGVCLTSSVTANVTVAASAFFVG